MFILHHILLEFSLAFGLKAISSVIKPHDLIGHCFNSWHMTLKFLTENVAHMTLSSLVLLLAHPSPNIIQTSYPFLFPF